MNIELGTAPQPIVILPENEIEEVVQNVRTIVHTLRGTVPFDRAFGIPSEIIDLPVTVLQTKMAAQIITAVSRFEPRAKVRKVNFDMVGAVDGVVVTSLEVDIIQNKLRGGVAI